MTDRPILFSAPMVRALLAGTKTQTRRLVKPQPHHGPVGTMVHLGDRDWALSGLWQCPYGVPGDRLWARESLTVRNDGSRAVPKLVPMYAADWEGFDKPDRDWHWTPSIHMPRWASRLWLTVADIRVQRLQEISEADAGAEGWPGPDPRVSADPEVHRDAARDWYMDLWGDINGPASWAKNPWVWAVTFTVHQGNIGPKDAAA